jgi:hypothetical protein
LTANDIDDQEVRLSLPHHNHIVHIGLHPFFKIREGHPRQDVLQPQQKRLELDVDYC